MTKRDAICDAALELFAEKSIEGTTIREIAQRAGAAEGTLYRHFEGKDDLANWLYRRCAGQLQSRLVRAQEEASAPEEKLEALIRGVFRFFDDRPTSCTYLLSRSISGEGETATEATDGHSPLGFLTDVVEEGIQHGVFYEESPPLLAGWILAMVQRTVLLLKDGLLDMNRSSAVDHTVDAALHLVQPRPS